MLIAIAAMLALPAVFASGNGARFCGVNSTQRTSMLTRQDSSDLTIVATKLGDLHLALVMGDANSPGWVGLTASVTDANGTMVESEFELSHWLHNETGNCNAHYVNYQNMTQRDLPACARTQLSHTSNHQKPFSSLVFAFKTNGTTFQALVLEGAKVNYSANATAMKEAQTFRRGQVSLVGLQDISKEPTAVKVVLASACAPNPVCARSSNLNSVCSSLQAMANKNSSKSNSTSNNSTSNNTVTNSATVVVVQKFANITDNDLPNIKTDMVAAWKVNANDITLRIVTRRRRAGEVTVEVTIQVKDKAAGDVLKKKVEAERPTWTALKSGNANAASVGGPTVTVAENPAPSPSSSGSVTLVSAAVLLAWFL